MGILAEKALAILTSLIIIGLEQAGRTDQIDLSVPMLMRVLPGEGILMLGYRPRLIEIKNPSSCDCCWAECPPGSKMCKLSEGKFWCENCSNCPKKIKSRFSGTCQNATCTYRYKRGEQIGWSPLTGAWCVYCTDGKDATVAQLPPAEREEMRELVDLVKRIDNLANPSFITEKKRDDAIAILVAKYSHVGIVKKLLKLIEGTAASGTAASGTATAGAATAEAAAQPVKNFAYRS